MSSDTTDHMIPVGRPASAIVIKLADRIGLTRALKNSVELETRKAAERAERQAESRHLETERGKAMITKGLGLIQTNDSPEEAIEFIRSTLAAIDGSNA